MNPNCGDAGRIESEPQRRGIHLFLIRALIVSSGIILGQTILYGPSLVGHRVLLPLDLLAEPHMYIPARAGPEHPASMNSMLSDLVCYIEPGRRFAAAELRAGRLPMWNPLQYGGVPHTATGYSPFDLLRCSTASPITIPWVQMVIALTTGIGTYLFCRQALSVGVWPAAIAAWCYPLSGLFVFWQGYIPAETVAWLPWSLVAIESSVRRPGCWGALKLTMVTAILLCGGRLDYAGHILLASGIYALWRVAGEYWHHASRRHALRTLAVIAAGWGMGMGLAAPYVLPTLEYIRTGERMAHRAGGAEERPPVGLAALPQVVLPDMYGSPQRGTVRLYVANEPNQLEGLATTYIGLLATLFVAPLALCSRRHRSFNALFLILGFLGLSWSINVPGLVQLLRLPVLRMASHNRMGLVTSFTLIGMTAVGLEMLVQGGVRRRWWFWAPIVLAVVLGGWCLFRTRVLPEPFATKMERGIRAGRPYEGTVNMADVRQMQEAFIRPYLTGAGLCAMALAGWLLLWWRRQLSRRMVPFVALLLLADLVIFAIGRNPQCDPSMYFPRIRCLEQVAGASAPGRIIGFNCLPPTLAQMSGLHDIRGYDGVDPARMVELVALAADNRFPLLPNAITYTLIPKVQLTSSGIQLSPILDMLNVRYVIFREDPPPGIVPTYASEDYWVLTNNRALPRVFVPQRVEVVADNETRLRKLADPKFNAGEVAYVESSVSMLGPCRGSARIVREIPTSVTVEVNMQTPGLVVLGDLWDKGWKAYLDGRPTRIVRTNHALRGVEATAGKAVLEFRYEPDSLSWGCRCSGLAATLLIGWCAMSSAGGMGSYKATGKG